MLNKNGVSSLPVTLTKDMLENVIVKPGKHGYCKTESKIYMDLKYKIRGPKEMLTLLGISLENSPPLPRLGVVRWTLLRSPVSDQALFLALVIKNTQVLDKGNFLSIPERFRMGSYFLN